MFVSSAWAAEEFEYKIGITGQNTVNDKLSTGAGTGSQCSSTRSSQYPVATDNPNVWCALRSNDRPALRFTLTATHETDSPPPSDNNEVRVAVEFSGETKSLTWGGPLKLSPLGNDRYLLRMTSGKTLTHSIKLVNRKNAGKPPKGSLTLKIIEHCYTKNFVKRCAKPGTSSSFTAVIN